MERTGLSASPTVSQALARAFHRRRIAGYGGGRMDLMRDALKRVNRLTPFLRMEALADDALEELLDELFAESASELDGSGDVERLDTSTHGDDRQSERYLAEPVDIAPPVIGDQKDGGQKQGPSSTPAPKPAMQPSDDPEAGAIGRDEEFESTPLGLIVQRLCEAVGEAGTVDDNDLAAVLAVRCGFPVPAKRRRLIGKLAWSARGRRHLEFDEDRGTWRAGKNPPEFDDRFGDWSYAGIVERATSMLAEGPDPFEPLLLEIAMRERAPRILASIVGTALNEARKSQGAVRT
jgi:hypothetical protein